MRALSLIQPWATAIAVGLKHWETRSWQTHWRGDICIHASKGFPPRARRFAKECQFDTDALPLGMIIAVCELTGCVSTEELLPTLSAAEQRFGDYTPGRFAFRIENVRVLQEPVFHQGALGLWAVSGEQLDAVKRQLCEVSANE